MPCMVTNAYSNHFTTIVTLRAQQAGLKEKNLWTARHFAFAHKV